MGVTIEAIIAHTCDIETARCCLFIYDEMNRAMRNVSCITSDVKNMSEI